ncbi:GPI ethanolamine phosphate transferase 3, partial [Pyrenophora tritici-repentis]
ITKPSYYGPALHRLIKLRFRAEIELLLGSKTNKNNQAGLSLIALELGNKLKEVGVSSHFNKDPEEEAAYAEWSITTEPSVPAQEDQSLYGLELVSPILIFQEHSTWHEQMDAVLSVLERNFKIEPTDECSTHIHVSPFNGPWTLDQVKKVAKAVLYFEQSVDSLMPEERRLTPNIPSVALNMCAYKMSKRDKDGNDMYTFDYPFRWNFTPLLEDDIGTVEFLQPPQSLSAKDTKRWVTLAASFVQAALLGTDDLDPNHVPGPLCHLKRFLQRGANAADIPDMSILAELFNGKTLLNTTTLVVRELPPHLLAMFDEKGKKKIMQKKLKACDEAEDK